MFSDAVKRAFPTAEDQLVRSSVASPKFFSCVFDWIFALARQTAPLPSSSRSNGAKWTVRCKPGRGGGDKEEGKKRRRKPGREREKEREKERERERDETRLDENE